MKRATALLLAALLGACSSAKPGDVPTLKAGVDACARCGMAVSEERFAAGYVDAEGRSVLYDDLGELLEALKRDASLAAVAYAHDVETGAWLPLREAVVERFETLPTPMGTGYAAFSSRERAEAFRRRAPGR